MYLSELTCLQKAYQSFRKRMQWEAHDIVVATVDARHERPTNTLSIAMNACEATHEGVGIEHSNA